MIEIPLHDRFGNVRAVTLVDDCDVWLTDQKLWMNKGGYAKLGKRLLHRVLMGVTDRLIMIDHVNLDRLDNRRMNLRTATARENNMNRRKKPGTSSKYLGVCKLPKRWGAFIHIRCKRISLGSHVNEIDAARQYDYYVKKHKTGHVLNGVDIPPEFVPFKRPPPANVETMGVAPTRTGFVATIRQKELRRRQNFESRDEAIAARAAWCAEAAQIKLQMRKARWSINGDVAQSKIGNTLITIDAADVEALYKICWRITPDGYVSSDAIGLMHRHLMQAQPEDIIDHKNNNRSDNRRQNLRIVNYSINNHNRQLKSGGVRQHAGGKFFGVVVHLGKAYSTSLVATFDEALAARNAKAQELFGEFARLQ